MKKFAGSYYVLAICRLMDSCDGPQGWWWDQPQDFTVKYPSGYLRIEFEL